MEGETPDTALEGEAALAKVEPNNLSGLVLASVGVLQRAAEGEDQPIAVIGFSMGASLALWLAARAPDQVKTVVAFYGAQSIDFDEADAQFQGHFADNDHMVSEEDRVTTEAFLRLGNNETDFHLYPDTSHWFFETGDTFDPEAAELAWTRTKDFLAEHHPVGDVGV